MRKKFSSRHIIQLLFFILIFMLTVMGASSIHSICPFGGVVTIHQYLTSGTFVQKIHESAFILMIIMLIISLLFGGIFCGWICPFGTFQEWISGIGKKIFKKRYNHFIPKKLDYVLRYLRYGVLIWVIYMTIQSVKLYFDAYDPYSALFNLWSEEVAIGGLIILGIVILLSLFVERPWCKYACPYGAVIGVFNVIGIFKIRKNNASCISCKKCDKVCPMNIEVSKKQTILNHQCIRCLECTSEGACPVTNTVILGGKNGIK